jgi:hypothetical protein
MSHFTVTVALPPDVPADAEKLSLALADALSPFDENTVVNRYVQYTKEQLIAKARQDRDDYEKGWYAQYLADPEGYAARHPHNSLHLEYLRTVFPEKLTWTDEQLYASEIDNYVGDVGAEGEVYSTYNPQSQWDWYSVGGRWGGGWRFKSAVDYDYIGTQSSAFGMSEDADKELATDCGRVGDIAPETFDGTWGYVTLDGEWVEKAKMGWWGMSDADESESGEAKWKKHYMDWLASLPKDAWVVNVDCHI